MKLYQAELFSTFAVVSHTVRKFKITCACKYMRIAAEKTNLTIQCMLQFYRYTHTHTHVHSRKKPYENSSNNQSK